MAESEIMKGMHNVKSERAVNGKKYKCIFFDLDHTLWDYETNSAETLFELYEAYNLLSKGIPLFENFLNRFKKVNTDLWNLYDKGLIDSDVIRRERFKQILEPFNAYEVKLSDRSFPRLSGHLSAQGQTYAACYGYIELSETILSSRGDHEWIRRDTTSEVGGG